MTRLDTSANIDQPDEFFAELIATHEGRSKDESDAINARLILLLANHIGTRSVLSEALRKASGAGKTEAHTGA